MAADKQRRTRAEKAKRRARSVQGRPTPATKKAKPPAKTTLPAKKPTSAKKTTSTKKPEPAKGKPAKIKKTTKKLRTASNEQIRVGTATKSPTTPATATNQPTTATVQADESSGSDGLVVQAADRAKNKQDDYARKRLETFGPSGEDSGETPTQSSSTTRTSLLGAFNASAAVRELTLMQNIEIADMDDDVEDAVDKQSADDVQNEDDVQDEDGV
ncbi:hypothetical protein PI124_g9667 [Phytophthora idaei]|nr:hypothetical protein PI125_g23549 [Phytophthora idaei]KAG3131726.1 hypothetical protein PI126_g19935 [Phytophthora idaei]KAG3245576.1 hypothetical protein PI124_g9667 [Phytophthora idaei]